MSSDSAVINNNMWHDTSIVDFKTNELKPRTVLANFEGDIRVIYNFNLNTETFYKRIFQLNMDEWESVKERNDMLDPSMGLEDFFEKHPTMRLYLRTFSSTVVDREENRRVFTDDVVEMIRILLKKQKMPVDKKKLTSYIKKWKMEEGYYSTIGLEELREVFDDFGVDKSQITLVPDIDYFKSMNEFVIKLGRAPIFARTPDNRQGLSVHSILSIIFKEFIAEIDWTAELNGMNSRKAVNAKNKILSIMNKYSNMDEGTFVEGYIVFNQLQEFCQLLDLYRGGPEGYTPPSILGKCDFNDRISLRYFVLSEKFETDMKWLSVIADSVFQENDLRGDRFPEKLSPQSRSAISCRSQIFLTISLAESFKVKGIKTKHLSSNMEDYTIPAWKAHAIFMEKWMENFFGNKNIGLKNKVKTGIHHLIPLKQWTDEDDFMNVILMNDEEKQCDVFDFSVTCAFYFLIRYERFANWKANKNIIRCRKWVHEDIILSMIANRQDYSEYAHNAGQDEFKRLKKDNEKNLELEKKAVPLLACYLTSNRKMTSKQQSVECVEEVSGKFPGKILLTPPTTSSSCSSDSEIKVEVKETKKKKSKKTSEINVSSQQKVSENVETTLDEQKTSEVPASPEQVVSPTDEKTSDGEPIRCHKCFKSSQKSREARTKMKLTENRNEKLEKKLRAAERRIEELEVKLKESEQKNIDQSSIISEKDEEMEEMKTKIMDLEYSLQVIQENCEQLDEQLKKLKKKESKLNEMEKEIDLLKEENVQKSKAIKALVVRSTSTGMCSETRQILNELEEKKTELHKKRPDRDVKKKANSVIRLTDITHIQIETRIECAQFQKKYNEYKDALELNIQIIKLNPSVLPYNLPSIPEFPSLSSDFMKRYKEIVESQELDDMDCSICLVEMNPKLNETLKCTHCRRRFHELCGMEWKFQRDICPTCNQTPWPLERIPYLL